MPDRVLKPWPFAPAPQLVADVGGTNTRVALADAGVLRQGSIRRYANAGRASLNDILRDYLRETATTECVGVCVAVAGPVRDGSAQMTNLHWDISTPELADLGGTSRVAILNDLQAQGHALTALDPRHLRTLVAGRKAGPRASQLVVGAGTGFNAAPVHHTSDGTHVFASECGHIHLPQHGAQEHALAQHLAQKNAIATIEDVLCGRGLTDLHQWVSGKHLLPDAIITAIATGDREALESGAVYASIMGRVLADLALIHLPYGGIFLIGGVARAISPHLIGLGMAQAFGEMGRFSDLMAEFPVTVIDDDYAALLGCAAYLGAIPSR